MKIEELLSFQGPRTPPPPLFFLSAHAVGPSIVTQQPATVNQSDVQNICNEFASSNFAPSRTNEIHTGKEMMFYGQNFKRILIELDKIENRI